MEEWVVFALETSTENHSHLKIFLYYLFSTVYILFTVFHLLLLNDAFLIFIAIHLRFLNNI